MLIEIYTCKWSKGGVTDNVIRLEAFNNLIPFKNIMSLPPTEQNNE